MQRNQINASPMHITLPNNYFPLYCQCRCYSLYHTHLPNIIQCHKIGPVYWPPSYKYKTLFPITMSPVVSKWLCDTEMYSQRGNIPAWNNVYTEHSHPFLQDSTVIDWQVFLPESGMQNCGEGQVFLSNSRRSDGDGPEIRSGTIQRLQSERL